MLKSYDIAINERLTASVTDDELLAEEKSIARAFAGQQEHVAASACPVCKSESVEFFAEIGGAPYQRCNGCFSVFAPVSADVALQYQQSPPLKEFRRSARFQSRMSEIRADMWDDLLFWLSFRCARYLGGANKHRVLDWGNFFEGLSGAVQNADFCGQYSRRSDVLGDTGDPKTGEFDIILYLDQLRHEIRADKLLKEFHRKLADGGILVLSARVSGGLDILTLKGEIDNVYPYEHSMIPSPAGLELLLGEAGFELLEISTPGTMDIANVLKKKDALDDGSLFFKYFLKNADNAALEEFQRFLQKNGLSSHARMIAKKKRA